MEKSNDELIEDAMRLASSTKEEDRNLAILYFRKVVSNDDSKGKFQSVLFQIFKYFLEGDLGLWSDNDSISDFLLKRIKCRDAWDKEISYFASAKNRLNHPEILRGIVESKPYFEYGVNEFLNKDLGKAWVKSLRYDALVAQLKTWEEEDKIDSERMKKIKEIIGE